MTEFNPTPDYDEALCIIICAAVAAAYAGFILLMMR